LGGRRRVAAAEGWGTKILLRVRVSLLVGLGIRKWVCERVH
jgi:hypothetical protein